MRQRRSRSLSRGDLPPTLQHLVRAAQSECPHGHAEALTELTSLALRKVPSRGLFDPAVRGEPDLFAAIDAVATRHLALAGARQAWRGALDAAELPFARRDDLERTAQQVQDVSDTAYFYAGLAFGLAFVCAYRSG
jgi:hypothetical protein